MSDTPKAVFLSYASQDAVAAKRICDALRAAGVEVWFDQSELRGGDSWDAKIRRQIKECALFMPIISASTQARAEGYFRLEWRLADQRTHLMGRNRAFIFPVCVDQTPDTGADVPDSFLAVQWTRLPDGETSAAVAEHVRRLLTEEGAAHSRPPTPAPVARASTAPAAAVEGKSVAVLAFANLSNDAENEYFSDGISEELINVLAKVKGLKVSARTSAFHFKGRNTPVPEMARQLGVAYVVEGSVRKAGDRVRITAQLIKAADGFHEWSETFTRDLKDIFAVQDEIAGLIARSLSLKLGSAAGPARAVNPKAYRLFLEGRAIFNREVPAEYPRAIQYYRESLELDPDSALTWAHLALLYCMASGSSTYPIMEGNRLGREAIQKALALDPNLAKAHMAAAFSELMHGWDWKKAHAELQRAAELAPSDVETMGLRAHLAYILGNGDRGVQLARQALELDPLSYFSNYALCRSLWFSGDTAGMAKQAERMIALNPAGLRGRLFLCMARLLLGDVEAAGKAAEEVPEGWGRRTGLALSRFAQGRRAESDAALDELKREDGKHAAFQVAEVYAFRGEIDAAFEWLETSFRIKDAGLALMKCDPILKNLYPDPRWDLMLRKVGLADDQLA